MPKFFIGDLVFPAKDNYYLVDPLRSGLIVDILEDDLGTHYYEVDFIEDRGWFEDYQLLQKEKSDV